METVSRHFLVGIIALVSGILILYRLNRTSFYRQNLAYTATKNDSFFSQPKKLKVKILAFALIFTGTILLWSNARIKSNKTTPQQSETTQAENF